MSDHHILKSNLLFAIQHIKDTCRVKTYIFDSDNNRLTTDGELLEPEKGSKKFVPGKEIVAAAREACMVENCPQVWAETDKIFYTGVRLSTSNTLFLCGPMTADLLTDDESMDYAKKHHRSLDSLTIPYVSASILVTSSTTFCYLVTGIAHSKEVVMHLNTVITELYASKWITYRLDAIEQGRLSYQYELEWTKQIENGVYRFDESMIELYTNNNEIVGTLARTSHKQIEYTFASALSLISRAAMRGGVDPYTSYTLSDVYFQQIAEAETESEMRHIYVHAIRAFCEMVSAAKDSRKQSSVSDKCKLFIDQNIYNKITVHIIADAIGISPNHLSSIFVKDTGITLTKYIHLKRLERASELLRHSSMEINQISEKLMFCSQSHMTDLFKKQYGMTPQKYRNRHGVHMVKSYL